MKKILTNYLYNATYQLLLIALPFLTTPYLSRILGPSQLGRYGVVLSVSQFMVVIITMGLGQLGVRTIAEKKAVDRDKHFWSLFTIQFSSGIIVSLVYMLFTWTIFKESSLLYVAQFPFVLAYIFDISWLFQGLELFKKVVIRNSTIKLISVGLIFIFVKHKEDLLLYILINSLSFMASNTVFWLGIKNYIGKFNFDKELFLQYLPQSFYLLVPQILTQIIITLDKPILYFFSDSTQVAFYDQSQKLARIILSVITTLNIVMLPGLSKLASQNDKFGIKKKIEQSFQFSYTLGAFFSVTMCNFSDVFVPWFFDSKFTPMIVNLKIVSFLILVIPVGLVFSNQYALAIKNDKAYLYPLVLGALTSLCIYPILMGSLRSLGGSFAILIVETIICFSRMIYVGEDFHYQRLFRENKNTTIIFFSLLAIGTLINIGSSIFSLTLSQHWMSLILLHIIGFILIARKFLKIYFLKKKELKNE